MTICKTHLLLMIGRKSIDLQNFTVYNHNTFKNECDISKHCCCLKTPLLVVAIKYNYLNGVN